MRRVGLAVLLAVLAVAASVVTDSRGQQTSLSDERTNVIATADVAAGQTRIVIDVARDKGSVRALRIVSADGRVTIVRARIVYGNGQIHFEDRGKPFSLERGERTREIDRRQEERFIDTIELTLEPPRAAVRIEIHAQQSREGAARSRANESVAVPRSVADTPAPPKTRGPTVGAPSAPNASDGARGAGPAPPAESIRRDVCKQDVCAEVVVLYGTDRRGEQVTAGAGTRMSFSAERGAETTLGRAVVSIPSEKRRPKGTWSRPELDFVVWRIQRAESMDRDVTLLGVEQLSPDAFLTSARRELGGRPRAFVFVHGYNVSFDDAIFRTAQIAHDTGFDGLAFAYSWPSKGGVFDYNTDSENASFAAGRLQDFLEMVATGTGASEVHLVAHSMGSKALLLALDRLAQKRPGYRFGEIILAAPDLLRGPFLDLVRTARPLARGITLYASDNDRALRLSGLNRPNEWPVGLIRNGPPVVAEGVQSIDVSRLNTGGLSFNHSTFAEREPLIVDMAALFGGGARYPHERSPNFERVAPTGAGAPWWRYSGPATTQPRR